MKIFNLGNKISLKKSAEAIWKECSRSSSANCPRLHMPVGQQTVGCLRLRWLMEQTVEHSPQSEDDGDQETVLSNFKTFYHYFHYDTKGIIELNFA